MRGSKEQHELKLGTALLDLLPLKHNLLTGDALYCQRTFCGKVLALGGDYLVIVKRNQPTLYDSIALAFTMPVPGEEYRYTEQKGRHGDRHEARRLWATNAVNEYVEWPGVRQVCKIEREVRRKGKVLREVRYAITSLGEAVGPRTLLGYVRGHWKIENKLHYVRDETFGEDGSQVRKGAGPEVMAIIRNVTLALLRLSGATNIAAALRHIAWTPKQALTLVGLLPP